MDFLVFDPSENDDIAVTVFGIIRGYIRHTHTSTPSAKCIYSYRKLAGRSSDNGYRNYIIENHLYGESTFIAASSIPLCVLFHLLPDLPRHQHRLHLLLHSRHVSEELPFLLGHGGGSFGWLEMVDGSK